MKRQYHIYLLVALLVSASAFGQKALLKKANKKYDGYAYVDARKLYQELVDNGNASAEIYQN